MLSLFDEPEMTMLEQAKLQEYEAVIERGLQTFVDVGSALLAIRDERLYKQTHTNFDDYCRERWGMNRGRADQLIGAAKVVSNLTKILVSPPERESHAAPLVNLPPEQQREAWQEAVETAPDGKITGAHVASVVEKYKPPEPPSTSAGNSPVMVEDYDTGKDIWVDEDGEIVPENPTPPVQAQPNRAYKNSSESNEWYTPRWIIEKALAVMGGIDLDPASSLEANKAVLAKQIYTIDDNALMQSWFGRVWLNPPYGDDVLPFVDKLLVSVESGEVVEALLLVAARTDTAWFRKLREYPRCFIWGRIKFINGATGEAGDPAGFPSMVVYMGPNYLTFKDEFSSIGDIYRWDE